MRVVVQNDAKLEITINRIRQMEDIFDQVHDAVKNTSDFWHEDDSLRAMLQTLIEYYESGQWQKDYESDERGELPSDLKRGVLSQDGVYDLLYEIERRGGICNGK